MEETEWKKSERCKGENGSTWFHTYIVVDLGPNFKIANHTVNRWMININTAAPEAQYPRNYVHITTLN